MFKQLNGVSTFEAPSYQEALNNVPDLVYFNKNKGSRSQFPGLIICHLPDPYLATWDLEKEYNLNTFTNISESFTKFNHLHVNDHFVVYSKQDIQLALVKALSGKTPALPHASFSYHIRNLKAPLPVQISSILSVNLIHIDTLSQALLTYYAPLYCLFCAKQNNLVPETLTSLSFSDLVGMKRLEIHMDSITRTLEPGTKPTNRDPDLEKVPNLTVYNDNDIELAAKTYRSKHNLY